MFKSQIEKLKNNVNESVQSSVNHINSSIDSISNSTNNVKKSINESIDYTSNKVNKTINDIQDTVDSVTSSVEVISNRVVDTFDVLTSTFDVVAKYSKKTLNFVASFGLIFFEIGITVAAVVAPVPTIIGAAIVWIMASFVINIANDIDNTKENKRALRAIKALKKYGAIPQTAKVKTEYLDITIDSEKGQIDGMFLKGDFKDKKLNELSVDEINEFINNSKDEHINDLLQGYLVFRESKKEAEIKIIND